MTEHTGTSSQLTPLTSQGIPDPLSGKPEIMDTGALSSSLYPEAEDTSRSFSDEEYTDETRDRTEAMLDRRGTGPGPILILQTIN